MEHSARPSWSDAELAGLLAEYFGEKLSPQQPEHLTTDVRAGIANRRARTKASKTGEDCHDKSS